MKRRWLLMYGLFASVPGMSLEPMKPSRKPRSYMSFLVPSGISAIILVAAGKLSMIMCTR